jgi:hypothetical protein
LSKIPCINRGNRIGDLGKATVKDPSRIEAPNIFMRTPSSYKTKRESPSDEEGNPGEVEGCKGFLEGGIPGKPTTRVSRVGVLQETCSKRKSIG